MEKGQISADKDQVGDSSGNSTIYNVKHIPRSLKSILQGQISADKDQVGDSSGSHSEGGTFRIKYENENEHLRQVLSARGLSRVCIRAEQLVASGRSSFVKAAGKKLEPLLAYPIEQLKEVLLVGSSAEGLKLDFYKAPKTTGDTDCIFVDEQFEICSRKTKTFSKPQVFLEEDEKYPGYVKLNVPQHLAGHKDYNEFTETVRNEVFLTGKKNTKTCIELLSLFTENIETHGPAVTYSLDNVATEKLLRVWAKGYSEGTDYSDLALEVCREKNYSADLVFCHFYDGWPQHAANWKVRQSVSNWPPEDLKERCVQQGCILAPVSPKDSPDKDIFWRISFNKAEQLLIESFNETQLHALVILKFLKMEEMEKISGKNITSYILKTTMFWCMEEVMQSEWRPENLIQCVVTCLVLLRKWISNRFMPNYFIEKRNMFVHSELTESIASQLVAVMDAIIANPWQKIQAITPLEHLMKWNDNELALRGVKLDICQCITLRTNVTIGQLLCKSTQKSHATTTTDVTTTPVARISESGSASQNDAYSELTKHVLAVMYNVQSMASPGNLPGDCLGIIAGLVNKLLDEEGPNLARKYVDLDEKVWNESRFEVLDKYRNILWDDLVEDDRQRTIETLRGATEEGDQLGHVLAAHLQDLNHATSNK